MKSEARNQQDLFFFRANDRVAVYLGEQFKVHPEIIETENYITESFLIHHYQISNQWNTHMDALKKGEVWMRDFEAKIEDFNVPGQNSRLNFDDPVMHAMDEDEGEDWDDEDEEEWDEEEDEDEWDEDEEDWDEDEEDWDEDEEDEEDWEEDEE